VIQLEKVFWVKNQIWNILLFGFMYWIPMTLKNMVFWMHKSQIKLNGTDALGGVYWVDRLWTWGIFWFRVVVSWYNLYARFYIPPASSLGALAVLHSEFTEPLLFLSVMLGCIFNFSLDGIPANSCIMWFNIEKLCFFCFRSQL